MLLLRYLSLLCEGHNSSSQQFLASNNVVAEVAAFVEEIGGLLSAEMSHHFADLDDLPAELLPSIDGYPVSVIGWFDAEGQVIDLEKMTLLSEIVCQGFEALSEFCQGFAFENQSQVARTGPMKHLLVLGRFCGAYQFVQRSKVDKDLVDRDYGRKMRCVLSHECVQDLSAVSSSKLVWCGNDPFALEVLLAAVREPTVRESLSERGGAISQLLAMRKLSAKTGPVDLAAATRISSLVEDKTMYLDSRGDVVEVDVAALEKNVYFRILNFGQVLSDLEAASLKLALSVLEGARVETDAEICRIVLESLGVSTLVSNMTNYWLRFKAFTPDRRFRTKVGKESCFEREMAFNYYQLARRFCDMPLAMSEELRQAVQEMLLKHRLKVDAVSPLIVTLTLSLT